jgi:hypothetical protein
MVAPNLLQNSSFDDDESTLSAADVAKSAVSQEHPVVVERPTTTGKQNDTRPTTRKKTVCFHDDVDVRIIQSRYDLSQDDRDELYFTPEEKHQSRWEIRMALERLSSGLPHPEEDFSSRGLEFYEPTANRERKQRIHCGVQAVLMEQARGEGLSESWLAYVYHDLTAASVRNALKRGLMDEQFKSPGPPQVQTMIR